MLNVLGLAAEAATQTAVLCSDAGRAGVLLAVALHEAAHGDERHGRKTKLLGTQHRHQYDIPSGFQLSVCLQADLSPEAVHH